ncbi:protein kinase domain-containing protein [Fimbriiglobus ruber]|uniref:non-specific serine/threonine protein kinase n=1 Tax=Fimbriiglobus ruber TaxID=1908690 RepID=A0A225DH25_9BACT|nr:protein kinase [Fimbriiglobus ruber]OWK40283.1 Serine/threonine protein kinase PrkC, regulator of stationary phase [Fimbriiglobus ruber]
MVSDPRVERAVEAMLDSGCSVREACRDYPELLPQVRERWQRVNAVRVQVGALFPEAGHPAPDTTSPEPSVTSLPRIPGYDIHGVLGRGGMGVVYKALHLVLKRPVALKMLLVGPYARPDERERFQREAVAVAGLRHANIVQVHDVGEYEGRPYFTMEFVDGGSLAQKLAGDPLPAREAASLLATLAGAVHEAHSGGIVHRDLKPANVLLTAVGTPKIGDFGLARRLDEGAGLTQSGTAIGTPSYMAPEQALGKAHAVGPAADVYALGAILYELLTGRPPFRAETAAETVQQVLAQDPVPPSRFNGKLHRDLETICLKCLHKESQHRYPSAAALADDLRRFLNGEAIAARPESRLERVARRVRRRPAFSAALVGGTLLTVALTCGWLWLLAERAATAQTIKAEQAATARAVEDDLQEMVRCEAAASWPEATAALERARVRLGDRGPASLHQHIDQGERDLALVVRLDAVRMRYADSVGGVLAFASLNKEYEEIFHAAGLGGMSDPAELVAARVRDSNIRVALLAALDNWSAREWEPHRQNWVAEVARRADPNPAVWRVRARDPITWRTKTALRDVVAAAPVNDPSVALLLALAQHWKAAGEDPIPFLTQIQKAHPADFWVNFTLGEELRSKGNPAEAVRYLQAALAVRPAAIVHNSLGMVMVKASRREEAVDEYRKALKLDPTATPAHNNLGLTLAFMGRHDEAIDQLRLALSLSPNEPALNYHLGECLVNTGKQVEAVERFRRAIELDPKYVSPQQGLKTTLIRLGRMEEARDVWRKTIEVNPQQHDDRDGYAEFCLFLSREDDYRLACRSLLDRFGANKDPQTAERTGRACLLLPASADEIQRAADLVDRALAADRKLSPVWAYPYYLFAKGLADYRLDRLESAIIILEGPASGVLAPAPQLVLAMAQYRRGRTAAARKTFGAAVSSFNWRASNADNREAWVFHILRREAERMILPNLPAFLEGKYQPQDNDERFALLGACQFANRFRAAARLYADAFAADPRLAEDFQHEHRYNAARYAALAGCGRGVDGATLSEEERTRWRDRAREWLRADLAAYVGKVNGGAAAERAAVNNTLTRWRNEPDLAGLRDQNSLAPFAADERQKCLELWKEVDAFILNTSPSVS